MCFMCQTITKEIEETGKVGEINRRKSSEGKEQNTAGKKRNRNTPNENYMELTSR